MKRVLFARIVLTVVLLGGSLLSFALDWSGNHLLNPLWHPHARFHAAVLLFFYLGVASTGTWLLWRRSAEPHIAIAAAALLAVSYWGPFLFIPYALPSASYWAGLPGHEPRIAGHIWYPNLVVIGGMVLLALLAWFLGNRREPLPRAS